MCIACELGFWGMMDALPAEARERILREQQAAARLACDAPVSPEQAAPEQMRQADVTDRD
jgi:hypothetical protein